MTSRELGLPSCARCRLDDRATQPPRGRYQTGFSTDILCGPCALAEMVAQATLRDLLDRPEHNLTPVACWLCARSMPAGRAYSQRVMIGAQHGADRVSKPAFFWRCVDTAECLEIAKGDLK